MRILCIADIHSNFEAFIPSTLPAADLCVVAGDITEYGLSRRGGGRTGFAAARAWLAELGARQPTFVVAGNHDLGVGNDDLSGIAGVTPLIGLRGECLGLTLHGVSLCPAYEFPRMAGLYDHMTVDPAEEAAAFDFEPVDVIVSHCPPYGILDEMDPSGPRKALPGVHVGSKALLRAIGLGEPRLVVCGHVHFRSGTHTLGRTLVVNAARRAIIAEMAAGDMDRERATHPSESPSRLYK